MNTVKILDPRVAIKEDSEKNHIVLQGGLRYTEQPHTADSYNSNQVLFNFQPPSVDTITDRAMKLKCYVQVDAVGGDFQLGVNDGPAQFPLASIMDNLLVQINGESVSTNVADYIHALLCYNNTKQDRVNNWSLSTAMPDSYQNPNDWTIYGSAKNPLASYGENDAEEPRGGFPVQVLSPSSLRYEFTEPLFISPMSQGLRQEDGFSNVNTFSISIRWKSDLSSVWQHASAGDPITAINVSFWKAPELLTTFITHDYGDRIPQSITYPYHKPQEYIKTISGVGAGANFAGLSDTIKLNQIPRKLYVFARRSRATSNYQTANSFAVLKNINITWNNQSGLLGNASQQELYAISKKNGCNLSWPQFSKYRGSPFCLEFGTDIGLPDNEAPGVLGQYTFYVQANFVNPTLSSVDYEFFVIALLEGAFIISPNQGRATLGNLTSSMVMSAKSMGEEMDYAHYEAISGGSFLSGLKSFVNKIARGVQKVASVAAPIVSTIAPEFAPIISAVNKGAGAVRGATGGRLVGGRVLRRGRN